MTSVLDVGAAEREGCQVVPELGPDTGNKAIKRHGKIIILLTVRIHED
jgi:hypothetical protein